MNNKKVNTKINKKAGFKNTATPEITDNKNK